MKSSSHIERHIVLFIVLASLLVGLWVWIFADQQGGDASVRTTFEAVGQDVMIDEVPTRTFPGFTTDVQRRLIDLAQLVSGGPKKDGIPALTNPKVVDALESTLRTDDLGVFVDLGGVQRFYPYRVLVWHEVVNDVVGGEYIAVTFCPLCGSAIVFDREVGGETLEFGVSGFLYESNMVMYDRTTESFWSQSLGKSIVGAYAGVMLQHVPMQVLTFEEAWNQAPNVEVLAFETGYDRDYSFDPYSGYEESAELMFPVSITDTRFGAKDLMYAFRIGGQGVAIPVARLQEGDEIVTTIQGVEVSAQKTKGVIEVRQDTQVIPGYYEMWFSWIIHNHATGIVWE